MVQTLVANIIQLLEQALLAALVAAAGWLLSPLIKIRAKKPVSCRCRLDLGVASVAVVITIGGTRQDRKALNDTKSEDRDS
jgi:hypothetical protein